VFDTALVPIPILADKARLALANIVPDERGTIRSMPLVAYVQGAEQPTLGLAITASYLRRRDAFDAHTDSSLDVAGRSIPLEDGAAVRINYFGPPSQPYVPGATFRVISFVDVLRGRIDPSAWRGGVVLIGALGATGLADDYWTPMSAQGQKMAGVEIHANVAGTLFSTRFLSPAPLALQVVIIFALALLMALLAANLGGPAMLIAPILALGAYVAGDALAFYAYGLLLPFSTPILAGLVALSGTAVQRGSQAMASASQARPTAERRALVASLRRALDTEQLVLYYQPKVACGSRRLAGLEALARWQHPELGLVGPERFIGLAEETGLIVPLTRWALNAAVAQARAWMDVGLDVPIAVNLSAVDVQDPLMPTVIADLLVRWGVPARLLTVEITEGALLADPRLALDVLQRLERLGVLASIDDYGSGYSSLGYLKQFPVHELKIDRSLVSDIVDEPRDQTIVRSTIELGHSLGLSVVAEGVEDTATLTLLESLGCDLAQGYYMARPMPAASLVNWLQGWEQANARWAA
jgi:EAL domain-containing protein (putative c-di-GMP-specific phosphodiesterase class I)